MEIRSLALEECELREENGKQTIAGYAARFNALSEDLGGFREQIAPGAFANSIKDRDILALWSHDSSAPLGRTSNGTLRLAENNRGLRFELDLPDTQAGRDCYALVKRGDIKGMSFGFGVKKDNWQQTGDLVQRTLEEVDLREVSPVAWPAYPQTACAARSLPDILAAGLATLKPAEPPPAAPAPEAPKFQIARERAKLF